jgi:hypothetical protein
LGKWQKYTCTENVFLELRLQGLFKIVLKSEKYGLDDSQTRVFYRDSSQKDEKAFVRLEPENVPPKEYEPKNFIFPCAGLESYPNLYFEVIALSDEAILHGGEYFTLLDGPAPDPARIAVAISACGQKTQSAAQLALLREILHPPFNTVTEKLFRVYMVDNGGRLPPDLMPDELGALLPNPDTGEAGAIARGLLEIWEDHKTLPFSHVLFLPGDSFVSANILMRLVNFLSLLRPEYAKAAVSFGALDADLRYRQIYSGARWNGSAQVARKPSVDLRGFPHVLKNEIIDKINIAPQQAGACFPIRRTLTHGKLPLPLFTGMADVDFSLRTSPEVMTLNGLCLWRPDTVGREPPFFEYYRVRNTCIIQAARGQAMDPKNIRLCLRRRLLEHIFTFRYGEAGLMLDAIEDFCAGVDAFKSLSPQDLHKRILDKAPTLRPIEKQSYPFLYRRYEQCRKKSPETRFSRLIRKATVNGRLLPPLPTAVLSVAERAASRLFRVRRVFFYDEAAQSGYAAGWDTAGVKNLLRRWFGIGPLLRGRYAAVCQEWRERADELRSEEFWRSYLRLPPK